VTYHDVKSTGLYDNPAVGTKPRRMHEKKGTFFSGIKRRIGFAIRFIGIYGIYEIESLPAAKATTIFDIPLADEFLLQIARPGRVRSTIHNSINIHCYLPS
jgi:hypothetical protein